jgi:hypothetical protein
MFYGHIQTEIIYGTFFQYTLSYTIENKESLIFNRSTQHNGGANHENDISVVCSCFFDFILYRV